MGRESAADRRGRDLEIALLVIAALVVTQSVLHLVLVLDDRRIGTMFDLDRSNGVPDVVSTIALAAAAAGAVALARADERRARVTLLAVLLTVLTLADLFHDGAHPASGIGKVVIGLVGLTGGLLAYQMRHFSGRSRALLVLAAVALVASLLVTGLDRYNQWFERERGDPIREYQIVIKEGLELLGWSLVALALWGEVLRRSSGAAPART